MTGLVRGKALSTALADAVGVGHFVVANAILILGEVTPLMSKWGSRHPGIEFIYSYLDVPMYHVFSVFADAKIASNEVFPYFAAELIILTSSVLYGAIAYLLARFFTTATE